MNTNLTWDEQLERETPKLTPAEEAFAKSDPTKSTQETTERALRMKEENTSAVSRFKINSQDEVTDIARLKAGSHLHYQAFIKKLRKILPAKYNDWSKHEMVGLNVFSPTTNGGEWQYVCAVQYPIMPEYEVMHLDDHGLTNGTKYRGWRTVLLRLITQGFITEKQAHDEFGEPTLNAVSRRYRAQLYEYRNQRNN